MAKQVKQAKTQLQAERRALADRQTAERRLEQEVRRKAKEQAAREREDERRARASVGETRSRRRSGARGPYEEWLDERDARRPLTRADLYSQSDRTAADAVAAGGGMQAVIDATGLRTYDNVARLIDPAILKIALDNDTLAKTSPPE